MKGQKFRSSLPKGAGSLLGALALASIGMAQMGGGSVYNGQQTNPADILRQERTEDVPPTLNSIFLDAAVLINVHADSYVAVFGLSEEGATLDEARTKVHERLLAFKAALKPAGVSTNQTSTDFVAQNRIYSFDVNGSVATEKVSGFELKENISVKCSSQSQVDSVIEVGAKNSVFDLIKVDYVLDDISSIKTKLLEESSKTIRQKRGDYERLFGIKLQSSPQLYADKFHTFYPTELYTSYQAAEGESVDQSWNRQNYVIHGARKMRTFYYNPISAKTFDRVVNPVVTDPVIQCTLYLKLRFEAGDDKRYTSPDKHS